MGGGTPIPRTTPFKVLTQCKDLVEFRFIKWAAVIHLRGKEEPYAERCCPLFEA